MRWTLKSVSSLVPLTVISGLKLLATAVWAFLQQTAVFLFQEDLYKACKPHGFPLKQLELLSISSFISSLFCFRPSAKRSYERGNQRQLLVLLFPRQLSGILNHGARILTVMMQFALVFSPCALCICVQAVWTKAKQSFHPCPAFS